MIPPLPPRPGPAAASLAMLLGPLHFMQSIWLREMQGQTKKRFIKTSDEGSLTKGREPENCVQEVQAGGGKTKVHFFEEHFFFF